MLNLFAYVTAFAAALSLVALSLEHLLVRCGQPRRAAWVLAMLGSILLPFAFVLMARPELVGVPSHQTVQVIRAGTSTPDPTSRSAKAEDIPALVTGQSPATTWHVPKPPDRSLLVVWALVSGTLAVLLVVASFVLRRHMARWQLASVLGHEVLISEETGPALVGVLRPRIVVPHWFEDEPADSQALILKHEKQHIAAFDPLLLRMAFVLAIVLPWNLPLWWQLRRLRFAIELDCDARVLRGGAEPGRYGEVLLEVTRRATSMPIGAIAMSEPISALEQRIRSLVPAGDRHAVLRMIGALLVATVGVGAAVALEAPAVPRAPAGVMVHATASAVPQLQSPPQAASNPPDATQRAQSPVSDSSQVHSAVAAAAVAKTSPSATPGAVSNVNAGHEGDVDLRHLITLAADRFNKRFVVDPRVSGSVDLAGLALNTLTYHAFLEILGVHGFVAMPSGDVVIVIPQDLARTVASPIMRADNIEGDDSEVVTVLIPVGEGQGNQLNVVIRQLVSIWGTVLTTPGGKSMIVVEKVANAKRIAALVQEQLKSP